MISFHVTNICFVALRVWRECSTAQKNNVILTTVTWPWSTFDADEEESPIDCGSWND
jgi:hypothetical protein